MNYLLILGVLFAVLIMSVFLYLSKCIVINAKTTCISFTLFVLTIIIFETSSIYVMRTSNKDTLVTAYKIIWSSLLIAQVFRMFFLSSYTKLFYKKFILLFAFLSLLTLVLNLCLPNGLMREGISSKELQINYHTGSHAFVLTDFSKYALIELILVVLLNVHAAVLLVNHHRKTRSRNDILIFISFLFLFVVQVKLVIPFDFYFYIVHLGYLGLICTLVIVIINKSVRYVGLNNKLKFQEIIDETREEAIHMIIHDLKVPLSALKSVSESQSKEDIINVVRSFSSKMQYQVLDILDVYKQNSSTLQICKEKCKLNLIIENAFESVTFFIKQKNISLRYESDKEYIIDVDKNIIERVIVNLIFNSIKYTSNGGLIVIELKELQNDLLEIKITDNGLGIESEKQNLVFNRFETAGNFDNSMHTSTGLGLSFCKVAVEAHGSTLRLESIISEGTSVSFNVNILQANKLVRSFSPIVKLESFEEAVLTTYDVYYLSKYYTFLKKYSINEISDLRKIVKIIECDGQVNEQWLKYLKHAINTFDNNNFQKLIEMINPQLILNK
jgi:signal transduction histidine kinase